MDKIMDYDVVISVTHDDLEIKVEQKIDEGWQPFGQGAERVGDNWHQTVVKYENTVNRIIDYDVVTSNQEKDLVSKVRRRLNAEGWQPFGEGAKRIKGDWYQTIVMYEDTKEE